MAILNKKIFDPNPTSFGLDLSDLSVKVVQLTMNGKYAELDGFAAVNLAQGAVVDGSIIKPDVVVEAITSALKKAGITDKNVVCSLPETKAFLRIISVPQMTSDEVEEAIKWEMEANIPMSIDQVYYDWHILNDQFQAEAGQMSVLVVAVARSVVDQFMVVLEKAQLQALGFEVESLAQVRSLLVDSGNDDITRLIVDIGDHRTSFLIVYDGVPVFTSSIPLSAETMTNVIASDLHLSHAEAEKVKFEHGIGSVLKNDHIFQAMQPVIQSFVQEINKSINFYLTGLRYSKKIDEIVLCGGGSKTKGLVPFLSRNLGQKIELGDPWANVSFKSLPPINKDDSVQYTTAIGLAARTLQ